LKVTQITSLHIDKVSTVLGGITANVTRKKKQIWKYDKYESHR